MNLNQHLSSPSPKKGDTLISVSDIPTLINIKYIYYTHTSRLSTIYTLQWPHAKVLPQQYNTKLNQLSITIKEFGGGLVAPPPANRAIWGGELPSVHFGTRKPAFPFFLLPRMGVKGSPTSPRERGRAGRLKFPKPKSWESEGLPPPTCGYGYGFRRNIL